MSKPSKRSSISLPTPEADRIITKAAKSDPDAQPLTPKQLKSMIPIRALRGRPKSENRKLLVSVRYSPEVVRHYLILLSWVAPSSSIRRCSITPSSYALAIWESI